LQCRSCQELRAQIGSGVEENPILAIGRDGKACLSRERSINIIRRSEVHRLDHAVTLCAFDLLESNGEDLRHPATNSPKAVPARFPGSDRRTYSRKSSMALISRLVALASETPTPVSQFLFVIGAPALPGAQGERDCRADRLRIAKIVWRF
jgi:hypothetical protein